MSDEPMEHQPLHGRRPIRPYVHKVRAENIINYPSYDLVHLMYPWRVTTRKRGHRGRAFITWALAMRFANQLVRGEVDITNTPIRRNDA